MGLAAIGALTLTGCGVSGPPTEVDKANHEVEKKASDRKPYLPVNDVEFNNYNKSQELYDDPASIQWCTIQPQANTAPMVTIPVAGKLTSSSTSFFPGDKLVEDYDNTVVMENKSVDGMYHGSPAPYRYGFTPAGEYVSFEGQISYFCTTQLMDWQKTEEHSNVTVQVEQDAEAALKAGDNAKAGEILKGGK